MPAPACLLPRCVPVTPGSVCALAADPLPLRVLLDFSPKIKSDHNQESSKAKRHISYLPTCSRSYVAFAGISRGKSSVGRGPATSQQKWRHGKRCVRNKRLSRGPSASRPPDREHRRTSRKALTIPPKKTAGSNLRSSPTQRIQRVGAPVSDSGTWDTRLFVCRKSGPRTRAGILCRCTRRWALKKLREENCCLLFKIKVWTLRKHRKRPDPSPHAAGCAAATCKPLPVF